MTSPSICIVCHKAYGAFCGGASGHIGGVERQTSLLAKWLAQKGYEVSLLTWNEGGPAVEDRDGVRIIKIASPNAGIKGVKFFHPRWTGLIKAMKEADADVYYQNGGECTTGQVALWCRQNGRSFVFSVASNVDCIPQPPHIEPVLPRLLYRYGLRRADRVIAQTKNQQKQLMDLFGLSSAVIPMPCPGPADWAPALSPPSNRVLWIGRIYSVKRPDWLLALADSCPDLSFDLVGPVYSDDYARAVEARAKQTPNVTVHGAVSRERVSSFYRKAACLCSTSEYEGFPNTFLEAWSYGLPIVSTFDPDSLIADRKLGIVAKDVPGLRSALRSLFDSPGVYRQTSEDARRYFVENHRCETVFPKFEELFLSLKQRTAPSTRRPISQDIQSAIPPAPSDKSRSPVIS